MTQETSECLHSFYTNMAALRTSDVGTTDAPQFRILKLCIVIRCINDVDDVSLRMSHGLWLGHFES
jgi:hypothetical protein